MWLEIRRLRGNMSLAFLPMSQVLLEGRGSRPSFLGMQCPRGRTRANGQKQQGAQRQLNIDVTFLTIKEVKQRVGFSHEVESLALLSMSKAGSYDNSHVSCNLWNAYLFTCPVFLLRVHCLITCNLGIIFSIMHRRQ